MENLQKYGVKIAVTSLVLLVLVLGVYFVNDLSKGNSQVVKTQASTNLSIPSNFSIIKPQIGEKVGGKVVIEAKFKTTKNYQNIKGVFKVGSEESLPLTIKEIDDQNVLLNGDFDTKSYKKGQYDIKIYLYDTESNRVTGLADATFPITIDNP